MRKIECATYGLVELNEVELMSIDGGVNKKIKLGLLKMVDGLKDVLNSLFVGEFFDLFDDL